MIKVAILGASGYAGAELIRILNNHNQVTITHFGANAQAGQELHKNFGHFYKRFNATMQESTLTDLAKHNDCIITATPHEFLAKILTKEILKSCAIIDLSADFRLKNPQKYNEYYNFTHPNVELLQDAVYGLCELHANAIKNAQLIANPGCYPTCSTLCIAPLLQAKIIQPQSIIIDAKSGVSGAGRSAKTDNLFCEVNENIKAYGLLHHRHTAEIEQNLQEIANANFSLSFTPHLIPMDRGILITAYATLNDKYSNITQDELITLYKEFYSEKFFIRVLEDGIPPQTRWSKGSNFVDLSICLDNRNKRVIMMGALDNLIKGAAGQAIQNLNIRFGLDETTALTNLALFP